MNILPRLLYPIQMIPINFTHKTIRKLNGWFSSFIWAKKRARIKISTLMLPFSVGGLDLPDIQRDQLSVHLRYISDWVHRESRTVWFDIESSLSKLPLVNLLFLKKFKSLKVACSNPITISAIKAWQVIRRFQEGRPQLTSTFTPIWDNYDFLLGTVDPNFRVWAHKGLTTLHDLFEGHTLMSFDQLVIKYSIPRQDFFVIYN